MIETIDKRPKIIAADGTITPLGIGPDTLPNAKQMREVVGGPFEIVRVLREDLPGFTYTVMITNDNGLHEGLPRNQKATDIYLANARRQYPNAANPRQALADAYDAALREKGFEPARISLAPEGYDEDPYIAGQVLWFDQWTFDELIKAGF